MGKTPIASVTYENERISIKKKKNSLPYINCVLLLSCVVHGPIYGRFMGFLDLVEVCRPVLHPFLEACFKRRATAVLNWLDCSSTTARH